MFAGGVFHLVFGTKTLSAILICSCLLPRQPIHPYLIILIIVVKMGMILTTAKY